MAFLDRVLDPPGYGWLRNGVFYRPSHSEIFREFLSRLNVFANRKRWLAFFSWVTTLSLAVPFTLFFTHYFTWPRFALGFVYSMVVLGSHGTMWLHRHGTHRAFRFKNAFAREIARNLVIKLIPEETYIVSHHVHHRFPECAGDPYNVHGGWLYCFLADATHQLVNPNLDRKDYEQLGKLLEHTGVHVNSYEQYQRWGTIAHPARTVLHFTLSWAAWYGIFFLIGGTPLAVTLFGWAGVWSIGVRTYNYEGHGKGKDLRKAGIDFNRDDLSINQNWPGYVAGEWHNNHHLFPNGARSGFQSYQLDLPWLFIRFYNAIGGVASYKDFHAEFMRDYYLPYLSRKKASHVVAEPVAVAAE